MTIDVRVLFDEAGAECPDWFFAKGHHDDKDFIEAVKKQRGEDLSGEGISRCYARYIPLQWGDQTVLFQPHPGKGAFPVTMFEVLRDEELRHR